MTELNLFGVSADPSAEIIDDTQASIDDQATTLRVLGSLYNDESCHDIVFVANGRKFYAIKALVYGWSRVLRSMLGGEFMESKQNEITLEVDDVALEMFLKIVHKGQTGPYPIEKFVDLYALANFYEIPEIEKLCMDALRETSLASHCFTLIDTCEKYKDLEEVESIRKAVVEKISLEFEELCLRSDFVEITPDYLLRFLRSEQIAVGEGLLLKSILKWIEHDKENRVQYLDEILEFIRFPIMDPIELTLVESQPLLEGKVPLLKTKIFEAMKFQLNPDCLPEELLKEKRFKEREIASNYLSFRKSFKFTTLGCSGSKAPTSLGEEYPPNIRKCITLQNGIQMWKVMSSGKYKITAVGAGGGSNPSSTTTKGGKGAKVSGVFKLKRGQIIKVLVGQVGENAVGGTGGGAAGGGGKYLI